LSFGSSRLLVFRSPVGETFVAAFKAGGPQTTWRLRSVRTQGSSENVARTEVAQAPLVWPARFRATMEGTAELANASSKIHEWVASSFRLGGIREGTGGKVRVGIVVKVVQGVFAARGRTRSFRLKERAVVAGRIREELLPGRVVFLPQSHDLGEVRQVVVIGRIRRFKAVKSFIHTIGPTELLELGVCRGLCSKERRIVGEARIGEGARQELEGARVVPHLHEKNRSVASGVGLGGVALERTFELTKRGVLVPCSKGCKPDDEHRFTLPRRVFTLEDRSELVSDDELMPRDSSAGEDPCPRPQNPRFVQRWVRCNQTVSERDCLGKPGFSIADRPPSEPRLIMARHMPLDQHTGEKQASLDQAWIEFGCPSRVPFDVREGALQAGRQGQAQLRLGSHPPRAFQHRALVVRLSIVHISAAPRDAPGVEQGDPVGVRVAFVQGIETYDPAVTLRLLERLLSIQDLGDLGPDALQCVGGPDWCLGGGRRRCRRGTTCRGTEDEYPSKPSRRRLHETRDSGRVSKFRVGSAYGTSGCSPRLVHRPRCADALGLMLFFSLPSFRLPSASRPVHTRRARAALLVRWTVCRALDSCALSLMLTLGCAPKQPGPPTRGEVPVPMSTFAKEPAQTSAQQPPEPSPPKVGEFASIPRGGALYVRPEATGPSLVVDTDGGVVMKVARVSPTVVELEYVAGRPGLCRPVPSPIWSRRRLFVQREHLATVVREPRWVRFDDGSEFVVHPGGVIDDGKSGLSVAVSGVAFPLESGPGALGYSYPAPPSAETIEGRLLSGYEFDLGGKTLSPGLVEAEDLGDGRWKWQEGCVTVFVRGRDRHQHTAPTTTNASDPTPTSHASASAAKYFEVDDEAPWTWSDGMPMEPGPGVTRWSDRPTVVGSGACFEPVFDNAPWAKASVDFRACAPTSETYEISAVEHGSGLFRQTRVLELTALGARHGRVVRVAIEKEIGIRGTLDVMAAHDALASNLLELTRCYVAELGHDPSAAGTARLQVSTGKKETVQAVFAQPDWVEARSASTQSKRLKRPEFHECLAASARQWTFWTRDPSSPSTATYSLAFLSSPG